MEKVVYAVGDVVKSQHGHEYTIVKVHAFGTIDAVSKSGSYVRITGLPIYQTGGA